MPWQQGQQSFNPSVDARWSNRYNPTMAQRQAQFDAFQAQSNARNRPDLQQMLQSGGGGGGGIGDRPTLQQTPLDYLGGMMGLMPSLTPGAYSGAGGAQGGVGGPQAAGGGNADITTGITQPQVGQPQMQQPGPLAGIQPGQEAAFMAAYPQFAQPQQQALQSQYYGANAPLQNQFQGAQANAGLGWGQLAGGANRATQNYQTQQGNSLLGLLRGMV